MNRAAKARKYKKRANRKLKRERTGLPYMGIAAGLLFLLALAVLFLAKQGDKTRGWDYVSKGEWNSLISVFGVGSVEDAKGDGYLTGDQLKASLKELGLLSEIPVEAGKQSLPRKEVMDYYDKILDYLDLGRQVKCKTVLCFQTDDHKLQTLQGVYELHLPMPELKELQAYQVYLKGNVLLGIKSSSKEIFELSNAKVNKMSRFGKQITFTYNKYHFKAFFEGRQKLEGHTRCSLYIRNRRVQKADHIQNEKREACSSKEVNVILLNQNKIYRSDVYITSNQEFYYTDVSRKTKKNYKRNYIFSVKKIKLQANQPLEIAPKKPEGLLYLTDASGNIVSNGYYGSMMVYQDKNGYYIVNKVDVEKYLYSVVASEMPASFHKEALKAQAVCARSYAYRQMLASGDYEAYHAQIDDSTNYQVYNLSQTSQAHKDAVDATAGEVMYAGSEIVEAYYYSTSCGYGCGMEVWNHAGEVSYLQPKAWREGGEQKFDLSSERDFAAYISKSDSKAFDLKSPYFRWQAELSLEDNREGLRQVINQRRAVSPDNISIFNQSGGQAESLEGLGNPVKLVCAKRSKSGAVLELDLIFEYGNVKIKSEYNIRAVLGSVMQSLALADGSDRSSLQLLPSVCFTLVSYDSKRAVYCLKGGGNGHGMGMSQYGADAMGRNGWSYRKILQFAYDGIEIR